MDVTDSSSDSEGESVDLDEPGDGTRRQDNDDSDNPERRRRGSRSTVWQYFTQLEDYEAQCNKCSNVLQIPGGTTTTLHRHIKSCYGTNAGKCSL